MGRKPTYEELEQRVMKLEKQAFEHNKANQELQHRVAELKRSYQGIKHIVDVGLDNLLEPLDNILIYLQFVDARYKGRLGPDADEFITSAMEGANRIRSVLSSMSAYLKNN